LHAREFVSKANEKYLSNPLYQHVQINIQENMLRSMLVNLFIRGIRSQVPENMHSTYMLSSQNLEYIREPLGMTNQYIGYTFLVDKELRVRWGACGDPMPEEAAGLERCVGLLLDREQAPPVAQVTVEEPRTSET
jgi:mitochondrial ATPase complex subunit ATP10